ncbi:PspA/IM30 family protein [Oleisolibacter albus]|uniref:PspA/IM30 family protein n=1 Tax=Oleisolibacter albus TaxID=2171757 RepID=UPI00138FA9E9|nr:PspA/IM30 family protein [Oleisolibacter albus]
MGLMNRLSDVINANLSSVLDRSDDPALTLAQAIRAMEDALSDARCGTVRLIAERKALEARWQAAEFTMLEWERKAELALSHQREDLARAALWSREQLRRQAEPLSAEIERLNQAIRQLGEDAARLETKLAEAQARRRSLSTRYRGAVDRLRVRTSLEDGRLDEALARCADLERGIDEIEAAAEVEAMGRRPRTPAEELAALDAEDRVRRDLEALRRRVAGG